VELSVLGCHGGETPKHRTSAFLLGRRVAIDAGALTSALNIASQCALEAVLISHAHLDHIRDLSTIADNRVQNGAPPLKVYANAQTLRSLRDHFFNDQLWPDFTRIPTEQGQTVELCELASGVDNVVGPYRVRPIPVSHTIDCSGFLVNDGTTSVAYSGDTAATGELWNVLNAVTNLRALLIEVSFPDDQRALAIRSGHHTPSSLALDLKKYKAPKDLPTLLYHMKPTFQAQIERECAKLAGLNLSPLALGDEFIF
jgi:3',5'-cyclic-nucleotide phosphodiesterase